MGRASGAVEIEPVERLEHVRRDWTRLAEETGHPFATWEWADCWWRRLGAGRELYAFTCRDEEGGEVAAILPLYVAARRPVGVARFLSGWADLQSPVCAPADRSLAAAGLRVAIGSPHRCRVLVAERLPGEHGWDELLGGTIFRRDEMPALRIAGRTWDEVIGAKKRKFRANLRRAERRLVEEHGLTFRLADDPERLPCDFDSLARLHASRWEDESTGVLAGEGGELHREFAAAALERGWLRLWLAEIEGEPVAAWYGWRFAGADWHYQSGRDPRYDRESVGTVLFVHTLREACNDGMDSYNFLAGGEGYKMHFADSAPGATSLALGSGVAGRVGAAAVRAAYALPGGLRTRMT